MSTPKHPKATPGAAPRDDLRDNPGIGLSKGLGPAKVDAEDIEGGSTFEGDVENDPQRDGRISPDHRSRRNK